MTFLEIDAGKSINPQTAECWYKANVKVALAENEVPEEVFQELKKRLDSWLPNPFEVAATIQKSGDITFFNVTTQKEEK